MNELSLIQTYYNEPEHLQRCVDRWNHFSADLHVILIDDGSKKYPAIDVINRNKIRDNIKFSLYAVDEDIGFNSHGCRNLGAMVAETDWLLFLDIDFTVQPGDMKKLVNEFELKNLWYNFYGKYTRAPDITYVPLNQFLIRKDFYWEVGGYNESYVRWHYGDREFLNQLTEEIDPGILDMTVTCHRGGRKNIDDETLYSPVYDNEKMIMYSPPLNLQSVEQITTKINFEWTKLL